MDRLLTERTERQWMDVIEWIDRGTWTDGLVDKPADETVDGQVCSVTTV